MCRCCQLTRTKFAIINWFIWFRRIKHGSLDYSFAYSGGIDFTRSYRQNRLCLWQPRARLRKPNADWTAFDPPKEVTHFLHHGEGEDKIRDIEFYLDYVKAGPHFEDDLADTASVVAISFIWSLTTYGHTVLMRLTKSAIPKLINNPTSAMWQTLKRDWFDLDFCFLRDHPEFSSGRS